MSTVPKEHQLKCLGCGIMLDKRDTDVLRHGWIVDGEIVCYTDNPAISYSWSKKKGDSVLWTHDKNEVHLN